MKTNKSHLALGFICFEKCSRDYFLYHVSNKTLLMCICRVARQRYFLMIRGRFRSDCEQKMKRFVALFIIRSHESGLEIIKLEYGLKSKNKAK